MDRNMDLIVIGAGPAGLSAACAAHPVAELTLGAIRSRLRFLLQVVRGEYADATEVQIRRELDYLESRDLVKVFTDPLGQVSADLTRFGIDIAEYTVPVEPGIARPPKV